MVKSILKKINLEFKIKNKIHYYIVYNNEYFIYRSIWFSYYCKYRFI